MTINIFVLKGDINGKIIVVRFFFCRVYIKKAKNIKSVSKVINLYTHIKIGNNKGHYIHVQLNRCKMATLKKTEFFFTRPIIA